LTALAFLCLAIALPAGKVVGQQAGSTLKNQLVGTWMLVSNHTDREDGSKFDTFGPNPTGIVVRWRWLFVSAGDALWPS